MLDMERNSKSIVYWAERLHHLATNLERDIALWQPLDTSSPEVGIESKRRRNVLWGHAQRAGVVLFRLCGLGGFDRMPRIKSHVCEVQNELKKSIEAFEVRPYYFTCRAPYDPPTNDYGYDVFFINIFEGFCRLWATSYEDQRIFDRHSDLLERGKLYVRILNDAGRSLSSDFTSPHV
jgi:hypothetical protein